MAILKNDGNEGFNDQPWKKQIMVILKSDGNEGFSDQPWKKNHGDT